MLNFGTVSVRPFTKSIFRNILKLDEKGVTCTCGMLQGVAFGVMTARKSPPSRLKSETFAHGYLMGGGLFFCPTDLFLIPQYAG